MHRDMAQVRDQELLAERDARDIASYRAALRKPKKETDNAPRPPKL
jgi:hypothetical protein